MDVVYLSNNKILPASYSFFNSLYQVHALSLAYKLLIKYGNYKHMIDVMRLDGKKYWVNPHMIESMESTPDLTLTMLSGRKIIVKNSPDEIIEKIINYRRNIGVERQEVL